jgi:hypothetical protein
MPRVAQGSPRAALLIRSGCSGGEGGGARAREVSRWGLAVPLCGSKAGSRAEHGPAPPPGAQEHTACAPLFAHALHQPSVRQRTARPSLRTPSRQLAAPRTARRTAAPESARRRRRSSPRAASLPSPTEFESQRPAASRPAASDRRDAALHGQARGRADPGQLLGLAGAASAGWVHARTAAPFLLSPPAPRRAPPIPLAEPRRCTPPAPSRAPRPAPPACRPAPRRPAGHRAQGRWRQPQQPALQAERQRWRLHHQRAAGQPAQGEGGQRRHPEGLHHRSHRDRLQHAQRRQQQLHQEVGGPVGSALRHRSRAGTPAGAGGAAARRCSRSAARPTSAPPPRPAPPYPPQDPHLPEHQPHQLLGRDDRQPAAVPGGRCHRRCRRRTAAGRPGRLRRPAARGHVRRAAGRRRAWHAGGARAGRLRRPPAPAAAAAAAAAGPAQPVRRAGDGQQRLRRRHLRRPAAAVWRAPAAAPAQPVRRAQPAACGAR